MYEVHRRCDSNLVIFPYYIWGLSWNQGAEVGVAKWLWWRRQEKNIWSHVSFLSRGDNTWVLRKTETWFRCWTTWWMWKVVYWQMPSQMSADWSSSETMPRRPRRRKRDGKNCDFFGTFVSTFGCRRRNDENVGYWVDERFYRWSLDSATSCPLPLKLRSS